MSSPAPHRYQLVEAGRGLASVAVLLFHSLTAFDPTDLPGPLAALRSLTQWGWLGVHVFFAISGWCIAERLVQARQRDESLLAFWRERFLRIYPTYWVALAVSIALRLLALPFNHLTISENLPASPTAWLGTVLLLDPYVGHSPYLAVSWTLVYELGFYASAGIALVLWRTDRLGGRALFLLGAALCVIPWLPGALPSRWFVLDLWPDFFAGVAAWYVVRRRAHLLGLGVLLLLVLATILAAQPSRVGRITAVATALLLIALFPWDRALSTRLPVRGLLWFGGLSYSLYLIHVPLLSPWLNLTGRIIPSYHLVFALPWLAGLALAVTGAWLLHHFVERPLQQWRKPTACPAS